MTALKWFANTAVWAGNMTANNFLSQYKNSEYFEQTMLRTNLISALTVELLVSIKFIPLCCFCLVCFSFFASSFFTMVTCSIDNNLLFKLILIKMGPYLYAFFHLCEMQEQIHPCLLCWYLWTNIYKSPQIQFPFWSKL